MADVEVTPSTNGSSIENSSTHSTKSIPPVVKDTTDTTKDDEKVKNSSSTTLPSESVDLKGQNEEKAATSPEADDKGTAKKAKVAKSPKKADLCENGKVTKKTRVSRELSALMNIQLPSVVTDVTNSHSQMNGSSKSTTEKANRASKRHSESDSSVEPRVGKRVRLQHQPFQSLDAKMVHPMLKPLTVHQKKSDVNDDRIVVFHKGDFLAVRNESGSFYVCRTAQNVYKTSRKFKIQWLDDKSGHYVPDFFDTTDFECVLTNLRMNKLSKQKYQLPKDERQRALNILQRAINVERGVVEVPDPRQVAEDGVDVSILGCEEEKEVVEIGRIKSECKEKEKDKVRDKDKSDDDASPPPEKKSKLVSKTRKSSVDSKSTPKSKSAKKEAHVKESKVESSKKSETSNKSSASSSKSEPVVPLRTTRLARRSITESSSIPSKKSTDVIKGRSESSVAKKSPAKPCTVASRRGVRLSSKTSASASPAAPKVTPVRGKAAASTATATSSSNCDVSSSESRTSSRASSNNSSSTITSATPSVSLEKKVKNESSVKSNKQVKVKSQPKPLSSQKKSPSEIINNLLGLDAPITHTSMINAPIYTSTGSSNSNNSDANNQLLSSILCGDFKSACESIRSESRDKLQGMFDGKYLLIHAATHCPSAIPELISAGVDARCVDPSTGNTALHIIAGQSKKSSDMIAIASALLSTNININASNKEGKTPLHISASSAQIEIDILFVENLIEAGGDLCARDKVNRIPLYYAFIKSTKPEDTSFYDPVELATVLSCDIELDKVKDAYGQTPLHRAAFRGATVCCMYLMRKISNIDALDCNGNSALSLAAMNAHEGCVLALINGGCNFSTFVNRKSPITAPRDDAFIWKHKKEEKIRQANNEINKHRRTVVQEVMTRNWQRVFHLLTHLTSDISIIIEAGIKAGKLRWVHRLLSKCKSDFKCQIDLISILCQYPSTDDSNELQEKILDTLTQRKMCDITGKTVLVAASNHHYFLCEELTVRLGVEKVASQSPDEYNHTPLTAMFIKLDQQDVRKEMKTWAASLTSAGATFNTLSHYSIVESPYPSVRFLYCTLESKQCKYSPLIIAVLKQNYPMVKYLAQQKADINLKDDNGRTALMHAARLNDLKMIKLLLNLRYEPETDINPWNSRFLTFKQMSNADLKIVDNDGRSIAHHLVAPLDDISYHRSDVILRLLAQVGAPLNLPDNNGESPLDLAIKRQLRRVIDTLQELIDDETVKKPVTFEISPFICTNDLTDECQKNSSTFDWKKDIELQSNQVNNETIYKLSSSCTIYADALLGFGDSSEILMDTHLNLPYSILLIKPDKDIYGILNFVKIQIVIHKERNLIMLFTRSGNVGEVGSYKKTNFTSHADAIEEFKKLFTLKTGNDWTSIDGEGENCFKPVVGKYRVFHTLDINNCVKRLDIHNCQSTVTCKLISDALCSLLNDNVTVASDDLHEFSHLNDNVLSKCDDIVTSLEKLIDEKDIDLLMHKNNDNNLTAKTAKIVEQIFDLSYELHYLLRSDVTEKMKPILEKCQLHDTVRTLHLIKNQYLCQRLLTRASQCKSNNFATPCNYLTSCLAYHCNNLQYNCNETQLLLQWIHNTSLNEPIQIDAIWSLIAKSSEIPSQVTYTSHPNLWLLFYELPSVCDLMSCLVGQNVSLPNNLGKVCLYYLFQGDLLILFLLSPHSSQGVYLTDMFAKISLTSKDTRATKFALICEVDLGKVHNLEQPSDSVNIPPGFHSIKQSAKWHPTENQCVYWKGNILYLNLLSLSSHTLLSFSTITGRSIPLGQGIRTTDEDKIPPLSTSSLKTADQFAQYMVPDVKQIALRYLIQYNVTN